jgi:hypothetical protein
LNEWSRPYLDEEEFKDKKGKKGNSFNIVFCPPKDD